MRKSFDDDKGNRDQIFEIKLKEVINLDQKFSQAMESEILVSIYLLFIYMFNLIGFFFKYIFLGEERRRK